MEMANHPPAYPLILARFVQIRAKICQQFRKNEFSDPPTPRLILESLVQRCQESRQDHFFYVTSRNTIVISACGSSKSAHFLLDDFDFNLLLLGHSRLLEAELYTGGLLIKNSVFGTHYIVNCDVKVCGAERGWYRDEQDVTGTFALHALFRPVVFGSSSAACGQNFTYTVVLPAASLLRLPPRL